MRSEKVIDIGLATLKVFNSPNSANQGAESKGFVPLFGKRKLYEE